MGNEPSSVPSRASSSQRRRRRRFRRIALIVGLAGFALAVVAALAVPSLISGRRDLLHVRADLSAARLALAQRDDAGARTHLDNATARLATADERASGLALRLIRPFPLLGSPARALSAAVAAGSEGLAAGRIIADASSSFPTSASTTVDGHDLSAFHQAATRSQTAVAEAGRHLDAAGARLAGPAKAVLPPIARAAKEMREEIAGGRRQLDGLTRGLTLLRDLTGPETEVRLLLLSQDTLELRPTGGYIGSYGVLHFSRGTARLEEYAATEDLPPASPPLPTPVGLSSYLFTPWGLSNANWSPDYPTTAGTAAELFKRQGGGNVDGVLALTELATARLIGALGSLKLPSYAEPVVEQGFDLRVVYEVELKTPRDEPRKKFLIEMADVLFARLFDLPAERLPAVADAVRRSIGAGDVQLWFRDPARQELVAGTEASGALPRNPGDFLMIVDSNMTGSKANLETVKQVDYSVERRGDARLVAHIRVEIRNQGAPSPINPLYNSYLRIYAPAGSVLLDRPFLTKQLGRDGPYEVFAHPLVVRAESQESVTLNYLLPTNVAPGNDYALTWVRQAGTSRDIFNVSAGGRTAQLGPERRESSFTAKL